MQRRLTGFLCPLLFAARLASAQTAPPAAAGTTLDVWPEGKMPGKAAREPAAAPPPASPDAHPRPVEYVTRPTLTFYPSPRGGGPRPVMIVCPGGGYRTLAATKEGTEIAEWLNSAGIAAVLLKYRVPDNREGALQDIQRALGLVRAHAAEWNVDPKRLGVIGFSAGGNLAAKASNFFDARTYPAIDAADAQSCRPDYVVLVYPAYLDQDGKLARDLHVTDRVPPTLIIHNEDDLKYVGGSKVYHAALDDGKVPNQFNLYRSGGHGYALHSGGDTRVWPQDALDWLHKIGVR